MKFYLTYWNKANRDVLKEYDFIEIGFTKFLMEKCIYFLKKHNYEVHLITDEYGKFLFKNLGWDSLDDSLESLPLIYSDIWSLGKIKSYNIIAKKGDPFFHIDHDAFLLKPLEKNFIKSDVLIESKEYCSDRCYFKDFFHKKCKVKYFANNKNLDIAYNCGIIGGKNIEFFYNYSKSALKMIFNKSNQNFWLKYEGPFKSFTKAILIEQYYLSCCLDYFKIAPCIFYEKKCEINNLKSKKYYTPSSMELNHTIGYVHFYGHFKNSLKVLYDKFEK